VIRSLYIRGFDKDISIFPTLGISEDGVRYVDSIAGDARIAPTSASSTRPSSDDILNRGPLPSITNSIAFSAKSHAMFPIGP
jgi:hypothetical protein